jgi:hypothetical protein
MDPVHNNPSFRYDGPEIRIATPVRHMIGSMCYRSFDWEQDIRSFRRKVPDVGELRWIKVPGFTAEVRYGGAITARVGPDHAETVVGHLLVVPEEMGSLSVEWDGSTIHLLRLGSNALPYLYVEGSRAYHNRFGAPGTTLPAHITPEYVSQLVDGVSLVQASGRVQQFNIDSAVEDVSDSRPPQGVSREEMAKLVSEALKQVEPLLGMRAAPGPSPSADWGALRNAATGLPSASNPLPFVQPGYPPTGSPPSVFAPAFMPPARPLGSVHASGAGAGTLPGRAGGGSVTHSHHGEENAEVMAQAIAAAFSNAITDPNGVSLRTRCQSCRWSFA